MSWVLGMSLFVPVKTSTSLWSWGPLLSFLSVHCVPMAHAPPPLCVSPLPDFECLSPVQEGDRAGRSILHPFEILVAFQHPPRQSGSFLFNNQAVLLISPQFLTKSLTKKSSRGRCQENSRSSTFSWFLSGVNMKHLPQAQKHLLKERMNKGVKC